MLQHREKFCVVWRELLTNGGKQPRTLCDDGAWSELLLLPVNAAWLRKTLAAPATFPKLQRTVLLRMHMMPLSHALLDRLVSSLRLEQEQESFVHDNGAQNGEDSGGGTSAVDRLRQKHAVETLGVLVYALLNRHAVDFKQQVLSLFCVMEDADKFWARLVRELMLILGVSTQQPGDGSANVNIHAGKSSNPLVLYIRLLALYLLLTLATACDNLQRNPIVDHFAVQSGELLTLFDAMLKAECPPSQKEQTLALLVLLCNYRKHETRSPFRARLRGATVNEMHLYLFSLRGSLAGVNALLAQCTMAQTGRASLLGANGDFSKEALTEMMESAGNSVIAWGAQLGSALGAWVSGMDPTVVISNYEGGYNSKTSSGVSMNLPALSRSGDSRVLLDAALWLRVRYLLLSAYELLCGTGGEQWMKVCVEHDVPPWALVGGIRGANGGAPQPLECSQLFLEILALLSFCLHSNTRSSSGTALAAHISLFIVQCMSENPQAGTLLFSTCFEDTENIEKLQVFERHQCKRDGEMLCVPAKNSINLDAALQQRRLSGAAGGLGMNSNGNFGGRVGMDPALRMRSQLANMQTLTKSLASTLIRQLCTLLIEHTSAPLEANETRESGSGSRSDPPSPPESASGQQAPEQLDSNSSATTTGQRRDRVRPGALCSQIVECLHRLLLFEKRTQSKDSSSLQGIEWTLFSRALFSLMAALTKGPRSSVFADLDKTRHTVLSAHLIHIFNLILSSECQSDMERFMFIYEILSHRKPIEAFSAALDNNAGNPLNVSSHYGTGSRSNAPKAASSSSVDKNVRLVQQSMSNLRVILFHFSQATMMIESVTAQGGATADDRFSVQARTSHIMTKVAESAATLKLRPHDRLLDGFQRYAETAEERAVLREFITELCRDTKALRLFSSSMKKNVPLV